MKTEKLKEAIMELAKCFDDAKAERYQRDYTLTQDTIKSILEEPELNKQDLGIIKNCLNYCFHRIVVHEKTHFVKEEDLKRLRIKLGIIKEQFKPIKKSIEQRIKEHKCDGGLIVEINNPPEYKCLECGEIIK